MKLDSTKLNKLSKMSLGEVRGRVHQELFKMSDRIFAVGGDEMSDAALYKEFLESARNGSGIGSAKLLGNRLREGTSAFLPLSPNRAKIVEIMKARFPTETEEILQSAEKALRGKFDLLGYTDLDFGNPVDWLLDPRTGERAPLAHWSLIAPIDPLGNGDWKVYAEIQRHMHFVTFGQAYWLSKDEKYVKGLVAQMSAWIDANPLGMGTGWAASLDVGFRAIAWLWSLYLCADSSLLTNEFLARVLKSLIEHGRHIEKYLSYYSSPNTHLTGEALSLFYLGVTLPELRRAAGWRRLGMQILFDQLPKQVRNDGVYFEQSSYYHRYTADFYVHLFLFLRANGITQPREVEQMLWHKLEGLFDHMMWIQRPDGTSPLFGDDDGGRLVEFAPRAGNDFRDTLAIGATIFKRGDWKMLAGEAPPELLWLLGPDGLASYDQLAPSKPSGLSKAFKTSGYFVIRDGWEPNSHFALIDCGRHGAEMGPCHAHADALSVELALGGTTWLVDPASYVYGADAQTRDWFRSTQAHNTVTIDGQDQSVPGTPFAWKTSAACILQAFEDCGDFVIFEGSHDGYLRLNDPVLHTRTAVFVRGKSALIIDDLFKAEVRHKYVLRWHFTPGCNVEAIGNRVEASHPSGSQLSIIAFARGMGLTPPLARIEDGWVSTCYGQRTQAPVAVFEFSGDGSMELTSVIFSPNTPTG